jgi:hypothetical protein
MEGVLRLYEQPAAPDTVRLCMDERPCQLLGEVMTPLPVKPGVPKRVDHEYSRKGTCVVLLAYDIDKGVRYAQVREQRTKKDYAQFIDKIIREHYSDANKIKLVQDNLNTHTKGSFYEHLSVLRAGELASLIDFVYTPKHGSWLNMAEIELSVMQQQCLSRRIPDMPTLEEEAHAWEADRNRNTRPSSIKWQFTTKDARIKLKSLYPVIPLLARY